jgi:hypothetical protein
MGDCTAFAVLGDLALQDDYISIHILPAKRCYLALAHARVPFEQRNVSQFISVNREWSARPYS